MPLIPPPAKVLLPSHEALGDFVVDLLGTNAAASKAKALKVSNGPGCSRLVISVWRDKHERVGAVCVSEFALAAVAGSALAAVAGSALALSPAWTPGDLGAGDDLPAPAGDGYRELLNLMTGALNGPGSPHLTLAGSHRHPAEEMPQDVWQVLTNPSQRRDFDVTVEGRGSGKISILAR